MNKEEIKSTAQQIAAEYNSYNPVELEKYVDEHDSLETGEVVFTDGGAEIVVSENSGVDRVENGEITAHQDVPMGHCIAMKAALHAVNTVKR